MSDRERNHLRSVNKFLLKKGIVTRETPLSIGQYIKAARLDYTDQFVTGYLAGFKKGSKGISILLALDKEEDIYELTNTKGGYFSSSMNGYPPPSEQKNAFLLQVDWQAIVEVRTPEYDFPMMLTSSSLYIRELAKKIYSEPSKKDQQMQTQKLATHERFDMVKRLVPDCTYRVDWGMSRIKEFIEQYEVDMEPSYQRDYVWDIYQKQKFVGALLQNPNSIPIFWFNWKSKKQSEGSEVVDGKQRMNALLEWNEGKFEAICPCEERFHVDQLDEISRRYTNYSCTCKMHFVHLSPIEVMKFYLALNSGGTIHSSEDLAKVRLAIVEANLKEKKDSNKK